AINDGHSLYSPPEPPDDRFSPICPRAYRSTKTSPAANPLATGLFTGEPAGTRTQDTRIKRGVLLGKCRLTECIHTSLSWAFTKAGRSMSTQTCAISPQIRPNPGVAPPTTGTPRTPA